ncbi:MAG: class I SAM-dependent methyltransferase, partial [Candidatus Marinimicrobia bacterium]|nr:class I SAM-dependent methyltransferase [Candidatus Neomarinimicrobiota bacterium]
MYQVNQTAIRYEGGIHPKHRLMDYHRFFIERLNKNDRVLDIGCGYGAVAFSMAKAGALVTGVDMDGANIQQARERYQHKNLKFLLGDVRKDLPEGNFNVIVMSNVLEH